MGGSKSSSEDTPAVDLADLSDFRKTAGMSESSTQSGRHVFSVHTTKAGEIGAVEIMFASEVAARNYARDRSGDHRVLSSSVTRFVVGELGTRHPVAWYADGEEQAQVFDRQLYPSDGGTGTGRSSSPQDMSSTEGL